MILVVLILSWFGPTAAVGASQAQLTTGMVASNASQATLSGYKGVSITYASSLTVSEEVLVFGSILNPTGQTVSFSVQGSTVTAGGSATFFFGVSPSLQGNLTMVIFVTTMTDVPLSASTSVSIVV